MQFRVISIRSILDEKVTRSEQNVMSNRQKVTNRKQKRKSNEQKVRRNEQKITSNKQKVTSNEQIVTSKKQKVTSSEQRANSLTSKYLFLCFDLIMIVFCNSLLIKGSWLAQIYFVVNRAREFNIRWQESWELVRLLSFDSKPLSLDRNSYRKKNYRNFCTFDKQFI